MSEACPIGPGTRVELTFSLSLESGEQIDSTGDKPAVFVVGDGSLLPGFEYALYGMHSGEEKLIRLEPESAFGVPNEENIQRIKRDSFQTNMALTEGLMMSFSDAQNTELPGVIVGIDERYVEVDFNHPLSGKVILFDVAIKHVEQVSNEILRVSS